MPRSPSQSNQNSVQRRQLRTIRERERRHAMTQEQRENYLQRRRSTYERRQNQSVVHTNANSADMNSFNATSNRQERLRQWRTSDHNRRQSMTEEERTNYLARRREYYRRSRYSHLISSIADSSDSSNNNFIAPTTMNVHSRPNTDQIRPDTTIVRQMCRIETIPYHTISSNFEAGDTSVRPSTNSEHPGDQIHFPVDLVDDEKTVVEDIKENSIATSSHAPPAQPYRPRRFQVIILGGRTTIGINAYDFGRVILRIVQKLKKHVNKRIALIEGWNLTEKAISTRRHMKENTLFRKKIRRANDRDIEVFYNHRRSTETTTST